MGLSSFLRLWPWIIHALLLLMQFLLANIFNVTIPPLLVYNLNSKPCVNVNIILQLYVLFYFNHNLHCFTLFCFLSDSFFWQLLSMFMIWLFCALTFVWKTWGWKTPGEKRSLKSWYVTIHLHFSHILPVNCSRTKACSFDQLSTWPEL